MIAEHHSIMPEDPLVIFPSAEPQSRQHPCWKISSSIRCAQWYSVSGDNCNFVINKSVFYLLHFIPAFEQFLRGLASTKNLHRCSIQTNKICARNNYHRIGASVKELITGVSFFYFPGWHTSTCQLMQVIILTGRHNFSFTSHFGRLDKNTNALVTKLGQLHLSFVLHVWKVQILASNP